MVSSYMESGAKFPSLRTHAPSVWVMDDSNYDKASELVSTFRKGESPNPIEVEAWRCSCGEENERPFHRMLELRQGTSYLRKR